ncbi:MAG: S8 family serine peptidase [Pseudoxanthomonas sp.]
MKKLVVMACLLLAGMPALAMDKVSTQAKQVAQQQGRARVVVLLEDVERNAPPALRNMTVAKEQRLRRQGDAVLGTLPAAGYRLHRRFARVPALVIEADAATLTRLERNVWVRKVDIDRGGTGGAVAPDESAVLNRVDLMQGVGLDGSGIKVAVVDTGVDTDHPDLAPRVVGQQCFCSRISGSGGCCPNGQATQSGAGAAEDDHGHGTNVSGIIVGAGHVAPRGALPAAQLVAVKVMDGGNGFCCTSDVVAALDWIATQHPDTDVVNLSLGTWDLFAGACDASASYLTALKSAVDTLNAQGTVVVASSGNQGDTATDGRAGVPEQCARRGRDLGYDGGIDHIPWLHGDLAVAAAADLLQQSQHDDGAVRRRCVRPVGRLERWHVFVRRDVAGRADGGCVRGGAAPGGALGHAGPTHGGPAAFSAATDGPGDGKELSVPGLRGRSEAPRSRALPRPHERLAAAHSRRPHACAAGGHDSGVARAG